MQFEQCETSTEPDEDNVKNEDLLIMAAPDKTYVKQFHLMDERIKCD